MTEVSAPPPLPESILKVTTVHVSHSFMFTFHGPSLSFIYTVTAPKKSGSLLQVSDGHLPHVENNKMQSGWNHGSGIIASL